MNTTTAQDDERAVEALFDDWKHASGRLCLTMSETNDLLQLIRAARAPFLSAAQPVAQEARSLTPDERSVLNAAIWDSAEVVAAPQPSQGAEEYRGPTASECSERGYCKSKGLECYCVKRDAKLLAEGPTYAELKARVAELEVAQDMKSSDWFTEPVADTRNAEADRLINRLMSSDPEFDDCVDAARLIRWMAKNKATNPPYCSHCHGATSQRAYPRQPVSVEVSDEQIEDIAVEFAHSWYQEGGESKGSWMFHKDRLIGFARAVLALAGGEGKR